MTHQELFNKALGFSETIRSSEAQLLDVLIQMQKQQSFLALGFTGIWDCCTRGLKVSESMAFYYKRVALKSIEVPKLQEAIDKGELTLSKARRLSSVITKDNSDTWIEKAGKLKQKELEIEVAKANPKEAIRERIKPICPGRFELKVGLSDSDRKNLEKLTGLLNKSREEVLSQALSLLVEKVDPEKKAERAALSSRTVKKPTRPEVPGVRTAIPAHIKHMHTLENGYQCNICKTQRYLNWHHIKPVSHGGTNALENLELLCSAHHNMHHLRENIPPSPNP